PSPARHRPGARTERRRRSCVAAATEVADPRRSCPSHRADAHENGPYPTQPTGGGRWPRAKQPGRPQRRAARAGAPPLARGAARRRCPAPPVGRGTVLGEGAVDHLVAPDGPPLPGGRRVAPPTQRGGGGPPATAAGRARPPPTAPGGSCLTGGGGAGQSRAA